MISTRKLIRMARKWQRKAVLGRKRVAFPQKEVNGSAATSTTSSPVTEKGHFVVYSVDQKRYSLPIAYLNNYILRELLRIAEEEFGLPSDGCITIPCEADSMDYLLAVIQRRTTTELEKALVVSITDYRNSSNCMTDQLKSNQCSFILSY